MLSLKAAEQQFRVAGQAADDQLAPIGQARSERRRQADVSHAAAVRRARAECAAREAGAAAVVPQTAPLGRTV
ncbi:hypothetical protein ACFWR9_24905 [Streptomyces sp. NPDC058534]|uniref:hypothetical protein n=1 Tax=Streptomyces sp. NPDC058534 TaxID=3346541 RepID=UPI00365FE9B4